MEQTQRLIIISIYLFLVSSAVILCPIFVEIWTSQINGLSSYPTDFMN